MCDASVQFVVDDVDLTVWRATSTTKGSMKSIRAYSSKLAILRRMAFAN